MLLFAMSVSLHLTSVWLIMHVCGIESDCTVAHWYKDDFTVQFCFLTLSLQQQFKNNTFFKLSKSAKYWKNMTTGNQKV